MNTIYPIYPVDLEASFRPSPTDPNWLNSQAVSTRAVTYGMSGREQQTYQDAYGCPACEELKQGVYPDPKSADWIHHYSSDQAIPYGGDGREQPVYSDRYGAIPTIEPISLVVGAVIGVVGMFLFKKFF